MPLPTDDDLSITADGPEFGPLAHALGGELERAQDAVARMAVGVLRAAELAKDPAVVEGAGWGEVEALRALPEDLDALAAVLEALRHYARSLASALPRGTEE
jgi:hypothetical protein